MALWPEVAGTSLADVIADSGAAATDSVRATGAALRRLHDLPPDGLVHGSDAEARARETLRAAEVVDALLPTHGARLRRTADRALELLAALPGEPPTTTHGDLKCANVLVDGTGIHLLDFDRSGCADPATDVGKFLADLRWCADGDGPGAARLHEAFLEGYGRTDPARLARAHVHDALLQLRMAARRLPVQSPDWADRVARAVGIAEATLAAEPGP